MHPTKVVASAREQRKPHNAPPKGRTMGQQLLDTAIMLQNMQEIRSAHPDIPQYGANNGNPVFLKGVLCIYRSNSCAARGPTVLAPSALTRRIFSSDGMWMRLAMRVKFTKIALKIRDFRHLHHIRTKRGTQHPQYYAYRTCLNFSSVVRSTL